MGIVDFDGQRDAWGRVTNEISLRQTGSLRHHEAGTNRCSLTDETAKRKEVARGRREDF